MINMLDTMKMALRIRHDMLDDEIQRNIDSALLDLNIVGVEDDNHPLVIKAVEFYVKKEMGSSEQRAEYAKTYEQLRQLLSLAHREGDVNA